MCCNSYYYNSGLADNLIYNGGFSSACPLNGANNLGATAYPGYWGGNTAYAEGFTNGYYAGVNNRRRCCNRY